jgi:hypothetical protein
LAQRQRCVQRRRIFERKKVSRYSSAVIIESFG